MDFLGEENANYNKQRMTSDVEKSSHRKHPPRLPAPLFGRSSLEGSVDANEEEEGEKKGNNPEIVSARVTETEQDNCNTAEKIVTMIHSLDNGLYAHTTESQRQFIRLSTAPPGSVGLVYTQPSYTLVLAAATTFVAGYVMGTCTQRHTQPSSSFRGTEKANSIINKMMRFVSD
jgi:hypothetical protein